MSDLPPRTTEDPASYWQPHIQAWQASGLSAKCFCRQQALPYGRFLYWCRKQRQPDRAAQPTASAARFARVVPLGEPAAADGLTVTLPNGVRIAGITAQTLPLLPELLTQL